MNNQIKLNNRKMKGAFKIGSIAGINIFIHWTFIFLIAYIIYTNYQIGRSALQIIWSVIFVLSIFVTVFLHELGHALAAKRFHISTKDITLLPIGGLARLDAIPEKPKEELVVAIAGPAVNIVLAIITGLFISIPDIDDLNNQLSQGVNEHNFFLNFFIVNFWLAVFNLIPAFPMDGGRVLRALLSIKLGIQTATNIAARLGQLLAIGFILLGFAYNPFLLFIGVFILLGAQLEAEYIEAKSILMGYKVKDLLMPEYPTIVSGEPVKTAVKMLLNSQCKNFLITENSHSVGTLSREEIIKALYEKGEDEKISNVMNKNLVRLTADLPLEKAFETAQRNRTSLMTVMDNDKMIGTLDTENILEFILVKKAQHQN